MSKTSPKVIHSANAVDFTALKDGGWFGRPKLSAKEMEAITSGGATLW